MVIVVLSWFQSNKHPPTANHCVPACIHKHAWLRHSWTKRVAHQCKLIWYFVLCIQQVLAAHNTAFYMISNAQCVWFICVLSIWFIIVEYHVTSICPWPVLWSPLLCIITWRELFLTVYVIAVNVADHRTYSQTTSSQSRGLHSERQLNQSKQVVELINMESLEWVVVLRG